MGKWDKVGVNRPILALEVGKVGLAKLLWIISTTDRTLQVACCCCFFIARRLGRLMVGESRDAIERIQLSG